MGFEHIGESKSDLQNEPPMQNFKSGEWLFAVSGVTPIDGWKRVSIYCDGRLKQRDYLQGPKHVHDFLKKVGYLS